MVKFGAICTVVATQSIRGLSEDISLLSVYFVDLKSISGFIQNAFLWKIVELRQNLSFHLFLNER